MNVIDQAFIDSLQAPASIGWWRLRIRGAIVTSGKDAFVAGADLVTMENNLDATADDPVDVLFDKYASLSRAVPPRRDLRQAIRGGDQRHCDGRRLRAVPGLPPPRHVRCARHAVVGLPEVQVGLVPGAGGTQRLPRLIGISRRAALSARRQERRCRQQALKAGLVHELAAPAELLAAAKRWLLGETKGRPAPCSRGTKGLPIPGGNRRRRARGAGLRGGQHDAAGQHLPQPAGAAGDPELRLLKARLLPIDKGCASRPSTCSTWHAARCRAA
jgi:3-hydroxyacyl-CoA dehydrogenase/enoyl-CoA hydratase/3-hydroxybutyryl-CoA epimerase